MAAAQARLKQLIKKRAQMEVQINAMKIMPATNKRAQMSKDAMLANLEEEKKILNRQIILFTALAAAEKAIITWGWPILAALAFILIIMIAFSGEKIESAATAQTPLNVSDGNLKKYKEVYEPKSFNAKYEQDETSLRLPWAVMAEIDSTIYEGKATDAQMDEMYNALKTDILSDKYDQDVYVTYTWTKVQGSSGGTGGMTDVQEAQREKQRMNETIDSNTEAQNEQRLLRQERNSRYDPDDPNRGGGGGTTPTPTPEPSQPTYTYKWVETGRRTVDRHLVYSAETWEGNVTRSHTQVENDDRLLMTSPSEGATAVYSKVWSYEQTCDYSYNKFDKFVKGKYMELSGQDPWDSQLAIMKDAIYYMAGEDNPSDEIGNVGDSSDPSLVFGEGGFTWPVSPQYNTGLCSFGMRKLEGRAPSFHYGIDISAPENALVYAAKAGTVIKRGFGAAEGNEVVIDHGTDAQGRSIKTRYIHLNGFLVSLGDKVTEGMPIAKVGNTGSTSRGAHLHFEVYVNGKPVDPGLFYTLKVTSNKWNDPVNYPGNNRYTFIPNGSSGGYGGGALRGSAAAEAYIRDIKNRPSDMEKLIQIANAEAGVSGMKGMGGVVEVIFNRIRSPFWSGVPGVSKTVDSLLSYHQFNGVANMGGSIPEYWLIKKTIEDIINGQSFVGQSLYFLGNDYYPRGSAKELDWMKYDASSHGMVEFVVQYYRLPTGKGATNFYKIPSR